MALVIKSVNFKKGSTFVCPFADQLDNSAVDFIIPTVSFCLSVLHAFTLQWVF